MKTLTQGPRLESQEKLLSELHQAFARRIYFFALRELRSRPTAEDVCNETLMRVVHAIRGGKLDAGENVAGFVSGTARNVIREFRRSQQRATPIEDRDFPGPDSAAVDPPLRQAIERVLQRLKPRDRDLLRLYYYEEQSKDEIARRLGIDPERVRLVKSRALKSFREFYLRITNPGKAS